MLSTTELFVEHIISGILSLVWIGAIALSITGFDLSIIPYLQSFWGLLAVLMTAIAYPIGIFVDTAADMLLEKKNLNIKTVKASVPKDVSLIQLLHELKDENITSYFIYNRFKTRVTRSSALNFVLIGLAVPVFLWVRGEGLQIEGVNAIAITIMATFLFLSVIAFLMWTETVKTMHERTRQLLDQNPGIARELTSKT
ncbi:MAG: hypothetical protein R3222_06045 [Balneolaceae bacterium]|nr:hypothetical protein [Balneolaceae bacterium]